MGGDHASEISFRAFGDSDTAEFAKIGVDAVSLIGVSTDFFADDRAHHTTRDTPDAIEPEAVEALRDVAVHFILLKDQQAFAV